MKKITFVRRSNHSSETIYVGVSAVFNLDSDWVWSTENFTSTCYDTEDAEVIEEIESIIAGDTRDLCLTLDVEDLDDDDIEYLEETIADWGISPVYASYTAEEAWNRWITAEIPACLRSVSSAAVNEFEEDGEKFVKCGEYPGAAYDPTGRQLDWWDTPKIYADFEARHMMWYDSETLYFEWNAEDDKTVRNWLAYMDDIDDHITGEDED